MLASAVITAVAFITVFVVTAVIVYNNTQYKTVVENRLHDVVNQVNSANQYGYEFDKRQQKQVNTIASDVNSIKKNYLSKEEEAIRLVTQQLKAKNAEITGRAEISTSGFGTGVLAFDSDIEGASKSPNFTIKRGTNQESLNHLKITAPSEKNAGIDLMSADNKSRLFVDTSTGKVNVNGILKTNSLQLGDKWRISGVGDSQKNDEWLRFFDKDGIDFYGGLAAANIWTKNSATLNGQTTMNNATVTGELIVTGGISEHNPNKFNTKFATGSSNNNYIRGDTEIRGNTINIGDLGVGRNLTVNGTGKVYGPLKVGHNLNNTMVNDMPLSVSIAPGKKGASFGMGNYWSHLPWSDGNTYIRPGMSNKNINIGDIDTAAINLGTGTTTTNVKGTMAIRASGSDGLNWLTLDKGGGDQLLVGSDNIHKGVWSKGPRNFSIYTSDIDRLTIDKDGKIINKGDVIAPSIGKNTGDNTQFKINSLNATNNAHPGTLVYQGMVMGSGGGLSVGNSIKAPEGQINIKNALKVRHTDGGLLDKAAISTWTPDNNYIGAAFGGPTNWSYFPYSDGDTYIRPGRASGKINIGDTNTSQVNIGSGTTENSLGPNSKIPAADGHTYIRPGANTKNVYIGDTLANEVRLGKTDGTGSVISQANNTYVKQYLDATANWNASGKTLFAGWNGNKVVLGNNTTAAVNYVNSLPQNTVASANNLFVYGNSAATNNLCINKTCINEGDLLKLKSTL